MSRACRLLLLFVIMSLATLPVPVQAQSGGPDTVSETYGDWTVRCSPDTSRAELPPALACETSQELWQSESGQRLIAITLRRSDDGTRGTLTILAPFGLLLAAGLQIAVQDEVLVEMGFRTCLPAGCIAIAELEDATVEAMAQASQITINMTAAATGEPVMVPLLTQGFAAAWARLAR